MGFWRPFLQIQIKGSRWQIPLFRYNRFEMWRRSQNTINQDKITSSAEVSCVHHLWNLSILPCLCGVPFGLFVLAVILMSNRWRSLEKVCWHSVYINQYIGTPPFPGISVNFLCPSNLLMLRFSSSAFEKPKSSAQSLVLVDDFFQWPWTKDSDFGFRCLGTCLLSQVPEPARRLCQGTQRSCVASVVSSRFMGWWAC